MTDRCFGPEDLDDLLTLSEDDPRREHLHSCSACRSLLASYRTYLDPVELPPAARKDEARDSMRRFIEEQIGGRAGNPKNREPFSLSRLLDSLRGPALVPALVLIAALAVVTILWSTREAMRPERLSGIVRDLPVDENAGGLMNPVAIFSGDTIELGWRAVEGADSYRVEILSTDLTPEREIEAGDELAARLEPSADGEARFWRVIALRNGDEIARSRLLALP